MLRGKILSFAMCFIINNMFAQQVPASSNVYVEPSVNLVRTHLSVNAGQTVRYQLTLSRGTTVVAEFKVSGGLNDSVNVWLLDLENFQKYSNGQQFSYYTGTSGKIREIGKYTFVIPQTDIYYLLVDNTGAWLLPRDVDLYVYGVLPDPSPESIQEQEGWIKIYQGLKQSFIFTDFNISIRHCGVENAFSNPDITLCKELTDGLSAKGLNQANMFVLFHELGHSLLKSWGLPLWDNEDAADEFATVFMVLAHHQDAALQAAQYWAADGNAQDAVAKLWVDDRHTLSPQRARNIIRWLNEQNELLSRWQRVIIPHMKTEALNSFDRDNESWIDHSLIHSVLAQRGAQLTINTEPRSK